MVNILPDKLMRLQADVDDPSLLEILAHYTGQKYTAEEVMTKDNLQHLIELIQILGDILTMDTCDKDGGC